MFWCHFRVTEGGVLGVLFIFGLPCLINSEIIQKEFVHERTREGSLLKGKRRKGKGWEELSSSVDAA
ncbi:hypothetical protein MLD38_009031 [Melastoma candidum]|uniref:Uncharacterized protein n=1 Tax=Melastoma candidum TaxID=119954 RepID=A0ACB9RY60_9MYRT|nr:hypothetical protein MLD38_009031 [Melastoma candidum]